MVLNTNKSNRLLNLNLNKSSREILLESYKYYVNNLNQINSIKTGSDKKPRLKIFNILRFFSFLFKKANYFGFILSKKNELTNLSFKIKLFCFRYLKILFLLALFNIS